MIIVIDEESEKEQEVFSVELPDEDIEGLIELKAQELERTIQIFDAIHKVKKKEDESKGRQMTEELEEKMPKITSTLKEVINNEIPITVRNATILKVKEELLRMMLHRLSEGLKHENIWKSIRREYDITINNYQRLVNYMQAENERHINEISELKQEIKNLEDKLKEEDRRYKELERKHEEDKELLVRKVTNLEKENQRLSKRTDSPIKTKELSILQQGSKLLTLKQLKDIIFDIYIQKAKYDERSITDHLPNETMEEYMYIYLNRIYGLKKLVIEAANSIVQGLHKYYLIDSDIALFRKILRNECDEDFRLVFEEMKNAMSGILKVKVREKYKMKTEEEVNKTIKELQNGEVSAYYWEAIIDQMYNEEHCSILASQIKEKAETYKKSLMNNRKLDKEVTKNKHDILYTDLQKILLDFQLKTHERYIRKFTLLFREISKTKTGIIDSSGFKLLLNKMNLAKTEEEKNQYLEAIDPYNHKKITYCNCLAFFSSVFLYNINRKLSNAIIRK